MARENPSLSISVLRSTRRAGRWFLKSGIRETGGGGIARYYRSDTGENRRVSTEITGYAAAAFAYLHRLTGDDAYRSAADCAARYLLDQAWDPVLETFPFEPAQPGSAPAPAYFFDCGIIARGLLAVWRLTGETEFLDLADACGRSMLRDFAAAGGFHPVLALPGKHPLAGDGRWSRRPGCYQLKAALAWRELSAAIGRPEFRRGYESVLAGSLAGHATFLTAEPERERVMDRLHAYAYFLEGLLPAANLPECAKAVAGGIEVIGGLLREIAPVFERSDVCAQLLRTRLFAASLGIAPLDLAAAAWEASRLGAFQIESEDPRMDGGFWFGRKDGQFLPFVNPVSTAFCIQAMEMWRQWEAGKFIANPADLI